MKPSLYFPLSSMKLIQPFGSDPAYYARFLDIYGNPQKGHMGADYQAVHGTPVYSAHDGNAIWIKDSHGGEGIWNYGPGFLTINWHLVGDTDPAYPSPIPFDNRTHAVKRGDLIGYTDNTGAPFESNGPHFHFGLALTDEHSSILNQGNGFGGCVDPVPYLNGMFAHPIDEAASETKTAAEDLEKMNPASLPAPLEENLIEEVIEKIGEELESL